MHADRRGRGLSAVTLVALLIATMGPLAPAGAGPTPLSGPPVDLNLWFHSDNSLSMAGNAQEFGSPAPFTFRQWNMTDGLQKDVCIDLVDVGSGQQGFFVQLNIGWVYGFTQTSINITVRVKDVAQTQTILGERTFEFLRSGSQLNNSLWNIPVSTPRNCMVLMGHKLGVEFSASNTAAAGDFRNAHLAFRVADPLLPTSFTASANGPAGTFYPNDLDANRDVFIKGSLGNAFDGALISTVRVQVRDPSGGAVDNGTATVAGGNYSFTWHYAPQGAGTYTAAVEAADSQGHFYNTTTSFVFAAYGLRMTAQGEAGGAVTRYTTKGVAAGFDLTVTNVGAAPTGVLMAIEASTSIDWTTDFSRNNFPLEAGQSNLTTFRVTPAQYLGPGNSTQVNVVAQAKDDPSPIKAKASLATTTIIQPALVLRISPARTDSGVKPGEAASFEFTIYNDGGLPTDVLFDATAAPEGWTRDLAGATPDAGGWRINGLPANGQQNLTLVVTAPTSTENQTSFECTLTAHSAENASAVATFVATTRLILGIELTQTSFPARPNALPSQDITFTIEVKNTDGLARHDVGPGDISVAEAPTNLETIKGRENGSITVFPPNDCCVATIPGTLTIVVHLPERIRAGTYALTVNAIVDGDPNKVAQVNLSLLVDIVYDFSIRIEGNPETVSLPEGTATLAATIVNNGNTNVVLNLRSAFTKSGKPETKWAATFADDGGAEITPAQVTMPAYSTKPIRVVIQAPPDAFAADSRVLTLSMERTGGQPTWELRPPITVTTSFTTSTMVTRMWQQYNIVFLAAGIAIFVAFYYARAALRGPKEPTPAAAAPAKVQRPPAKPAAQRPPAGRGGTGGVK